jgi:HPt (histidine-containing phosphotransfer) domain-containing protein
MERPTTLNGRLLDMRERFVRRMPDRIAEIASTLSKYGEGDEQVTALLERQFHTLAGTAGTYDLNTVAAAAFEGEQACVELGKSQGDGDDLTYLRFLVAQLSGALAADAAQLQPDLKTPGGARA